MPNVLIVVEKDIGEGIADKEFLGIISPLEMARIGGLSLQVYIEGRAKAGIGPMNADQQKIDKAFQYYQETL